MSDVGQILLSILALGCLVVSFRIQMSQASTPQHSAGVPSWHRQARDLPWEDQWRIFWANARGRAVVSPGLAVLARRRGEVMVAVTTATIMSTEAKRQRAYLGAGWILLGVAATWSGLESDAAGASWLQWTVVVLFVAQGVGIIVDVLTLRARRRRLLRSVRANRTLEVRQRMVALEP